MVKTPKGELTSAELRKLIKAHNILVSIKIPVGTDREGLIKLIEDKGYKVDHKNKKIVDAKKDRPRRPKVTLEEAKELTKPKPKTALQKQKIAEAKAEKEEKKKKEVRAIKKEAIKGVMDRKKALKKKSIENNKEEMPKPKQPKATQKFKSQKEDEVRPKEKVGRPKVDPKKIKVIEPKKKEELSQVKKDLIKSQCKAAVSDAKNIIRLYGEHKGLIKNSFAYKSKKEVNQDYEKLKKGTWKDCSQEDQDKIKKAIELHEDNLEKELEKEKKKKKIVPKKDGEDETELEILEREMMEAKEELKKVNSQELPPRKDVMMYVNSKDAKKEKQKELRETIEEYKEKIKKEKKRLRDEKKKKK